MWHLPASLGENNRKDQVLSMIVRMMNDTSPNSLNSLLLDTGLVFEMFVQSGSNRYISWVELIFGLSGTEQQSVEKIVRMTQAYITYLQDSAREPEMMRLFEEMRVQSLKDYHFGSHMTSLETTKDFATRLQYIDNADELLTSESWLNSKFQFSNVKSALEEMNANNRIVIKNCSKDTNLEKLGQVKVAPYSGAKYVESDWPTPKTLNNRGGGDANAMGDEAGAEADFTFIPENAYLHRDIKLLRRAGTDADIMNYLRPPPDHGNISGLQLPWRSPDDPTHGQNCIPKIRGFHLGHTEADQNPFSCAMQIQFVCPLFGKNTFYKALSILWGQMLLLNINSLLAGFHTAGFSVNIIPDQEYGLVLVVSGFPEHITDVVRQVVEKMFNGPVTQRDFSLAKHRLSAILEDHFSDDVFITEFLLRCTAFEDSDMSIDFFGNLNALTFGNLENFIEAFKRSTFCQVFMMGNLPIRLFETVATLLDQMPFSPGMNNDPSLYSHNGLALSPSIYTPGETCIRVKNNLSCEYTTTVTNMYMIGPYSNDQSEADYFAASMYFMNCQAFMELRNRQQLGYAVYVRKIHYDQMTTPLMMFSVTITATASKHTACELDQKIDQFLAEYGDYLITMRDDVFATMLQLTCTPDTVTKVAVGEWFKKKFNADFGKRDIEWKCLLGRIKKQSIQVFSGNEDAKPLKCNCELCESLNQETDWVRGRNRDSQLLFAKGRGITKDYFVTSPKF